MRFLTARRRHPAARALVLVFALLVMGALYSALAPSSKSAADTSTSQQVEEGRALFAVSCASCHGLNGEGQTEGTIQGPPLVGVGAAAVDQRAVAIQRDAGAGDGEGLPVDAGAVEHGIGGDFGRRRAGGRARHRGWHVVAGRAIAATAAAGQEQG